LFKHTVTCLLTSLYTNRVGSGKIAILGAKRYDGRGLHLQQNVNRWLPWHKGRCKARTPSNNEQ